MGTRDLWPYGRKRFLKMLRHTEAMLEGGDRVFSDDFLVSANMTKLMVGVTAATYITEKMVAFCVEQKR